MSEEAYKAYIKHEIVINSLLITAIIVAIVTTGRLYPLWFLLLLSVKSYKRFMEDTR